MIIGTAGPELGGRVGCRWNKPNNFETKYAINIPMHQSMANAIRAAIPQAMARRVPVSISQPLADEIFEDKAFWVLEKLVS